MNTLTVTAEYARMFLANMGTKLTLKDIAGFSNVELAAQVQYLMIKFAMERYHIEVAVID